MQAPFIICLVRRRGPESLQESSVAAGDNAAARMYAEGG